jgi:predicted enzyme related to lactoylglutathione lyase
MSDRTLIPGKFVWFELVSQEPKRAQAFYSEVLGWRTVPFPMGSFSYDMIYVGDTMIGGYAAPIRQGQPAHWISYVSVNDVDAAAKTASERGGKIIEPPQDIPGVGRTARIADPQGAELSVFKRANGDPPDVSSSPPGHWLWNELHTRDVSAALAFYEKVVGFSQRAVDMGPAGTYHILSAGGIDRGGASTHIPAGVPPHWLPYVTVTDVDATAARARKLGATITVEPANIPDTGRFAVFNDPTGAALAIMNPLPRQK